MRRTQRTGDQHSGRRRVGRALAAVGLTAGLIGGAATVAVPAGADGKAMANNYAVTNLVSDQAGHAQITDPNLQNAWGLAAGPTSPIWVANNHTDSTTVYKGAVDGSPIQGPLLVVPVDGGSPTGIVFNGTTGFTVPSASAPSTFIFDSEAGDITAWSGADAGAHAVVMAHNDDANYKGLALAMSKNKPYLYAANFETNAVDVYDSTFTMQHWAGAFVDNSLPSHYAPFGIALVGKNLYVSYALHEPGDDDDTPGAGHGFIDVFGTNGELHHRLVSGGVLNSPWGMAVAPANFGRFSGDLLVGNFGDGRVHAFNARSGKEIGVLRGTDGKQVRIEGLWGLEFGNGVTGNTNSLLFSAGPDDESHGLFGTITAAPTTSG